jgi:enoyl-CoA hydratase
MTFQNIFTAIENKVAIITINRPKQLNALNKNTIEELHQALSLFKDNNEVRSIILTGSGEKAFVAGADIKEFADFDIEKGKDLALSGQEKLFNYVENFPKPIIGAINGFALGGGLELAMACHFRVASDNAKMGLPEVSLGVIPGYGGTQRLPQLVGKGKALELITTAKMINASQALQYQLVNYVVNTNELLGKCHQLAAAISNNSPKAISAAIKAVNAGFDSEVNGYKKEIEEFGSCFGSDEFLEGTNAFMEKRKANF